MTWPPTYSCAMSGVVPATSDDFSSVLNAGEASHATCVIFTLKPGLVFRNRLTPLVRNDWDAGTPHEPTASASFQMVMVGFAPPPEEDGPEEEEQAATPATSTSVAIPAAAALNLRPDMMPPGRPRSWCLASNAIASSMSRNVIAARRDKAGPAVAPAARSARSGDPDLAEAGADALGAGELPLPVDGPGRRGSRL